jgi:hypothetical protein
MRLGASGRRARKSWPASRALPNGSSLERSTAISKKRF